MQRVAMRLPMARLASGLRRIPLDPLTMEFTDKMSEVRCFIQLSYGRVLESITRL